MARSREARTLTPEEAYCVAWTVKEEEALIRLYNLQDVTPDNLAHTGEEAAIWCRFKETTGKQVSRHHVNKKLIALRKETNAIKQRRRVLMKEQGRKKTIPSSWV